MKRSPRLVPLLFLGSAFILGAAFPARAGDGSWQEIKHEDNFVVYNRDHAGSAVKELKAVSTMWVPNWVVKNVIDDTEHYPQFMPYMQESKVIARDTAKHTVLAYARVEPPLISERDYTILVHDESQKAADGTIVYKDRWESADQKGPAEKPGVVRIKLNEGYWLLEPIDNGDHTRVTYVLFTDGGGGVPTFLLNQVNQHRLVDLFAAVSKRAQDPGYRKYKPAMP